MFTTGFIATVASVLAGGAIAAVTVVGVVSHTVDSGASHPASVSQSTIAYGSTSK